MSLIESQNIKQINYLNCYLKIGAKKRCRLQNAYVKAPQKVKNRNERENKYFIKLILYPLKLHKNTNL
jgi:hypothetical protein